MKLQQGNFNNMCKETKSIIDQHKNAIVLVGVDALRRKVVHELAYFHRLYSSSFCVKGKSEKVMVIKPYHAHEPILQEVAISEIVGEWIWVLIVLGFFSLFSLNHVSYAEQNFLTKFNKIKNKKKKKIAHDSVRIPYDLKQSER